MNRSARRRLGAAAVVLAALVTVSGCATTNLNNPYPAADGVNVDAGTAALRNVLVVVDSTNPQLASLVASVINKGDGPETLNAVFVNQGGVSKARVAIKPTTIPPGGSVNFGSATTPSPIITGLTLPSSGYVDLEFQLSNAGNVPVNAPVTPNGGYYDQSIPSAVSVPASTPKATPTATP